MSKRLKPAVAVTALILVVIGAGEPGAAKLRKTVAGNVETEFSVGFSPRGLSKEKPAPIASFLRWTVRTMDGLPPPALREFRVRGDKHVEFALKHLPVCRLPGRDSRLTTSEARKRCGPAVVGTGHIKVGVAFPGDTTLDSESELLVINGGGKGGMPTLYAYAYLTAPVVAAVLIPIEVKKIRKGRFGTESIASIPEIVGGSGAVTYFRLDFKKGILRATCPDGHLNARVTAVLENDIRASAGIGDSCSGR